MNMNGVASYEPKENEETTNIRSKIKGDLLWAKTKHKIVRRQWGKKTKVVSLQENLPKRQRKSYHSTFL